MKICEPKQRQSWKDLLETREGELTKQPPSPRHYTIEELRQARERGEIYQPPARSEERELTALNCVIGYLTDFALYDISRGLERQEREIALFSRTQELARQARRVHFNEHSDAISPERFEQYENTVTAPAMETEGTVQCDFPADMRIFHNRVYCNQNRHVGPMMPAGMNCFKGNIRIRPLQAKCVELGCSFEDTQKDAEQWSKRTFCRRDIHQEEIAHTALDEQLKEIIEVPDTTKERGTLLHKFIDTRVPGQGSILNFACNVSPPNRENINKVILDCVDCIKGVDIEDI